MHLGVRLSIGPFIWTKINDWTLAIFHISPWSHCTRIHKCPALGYRYIISPKSFCVTDITPWRGIRVPTGHISSFLLSRYTSTSQNTHFRFLQQKKTLVCTNHHSSAQNSTSHQISFPDRYVLVFHRQSSTLATQFSNKSEYFVLIKWIWHWSIQFKTDRYNRNTTRRCRTKKCIARSWSNLVNEPEGWVHQVWPSWVQYTSSFYTWVLYSYNYMPFCDITHLKVVFKPPSWPPPFQNCQQPCST